MRIELNDENTAVGFDIVRQIRDQYGIETNHTQLVNLLFPLIKSIEFIQSITITLKALPKNPDEKPAKPPEPKVIQRTSRWMAGFK
jgi:hypothetical protein